MMVFFVCFFFFLDTGCFFSIFHKENLPLSTQMKKIWSLRVTGCWHHQVCYIRCHWSEVKSWTHFRLCFFPKKCLLSYRALLQSGSLFWSTLLPLNHWPCLFNRQLCSAELPTQTITLMVIFCCVFIWGRNNDSLSKCQIVWELP